MPKCDSLMILAGALAVAGVPSAGIAQDKHETRTETVERRIVIHDAKVGDKSRHPEAQSMIDEKCLGERFEASANGGSATNKRKVQMVLCADKGESLLAPLQKAETDLSKQDMPSEAKAEMLRQIRAKIAELRARG